MPLPKKPSNYLSTPNQRLIRPWRKLPNWRRKHQGFTLIELLIVIAILTIMAAAVIIAVNPAKRTRQARDAARKQHINNIANALIGYYTLTGRYPQDAISGCDTSIGLHSFSAFCPPGFNPPFGGDQWFPDTPFLYFSLVTQQGFLKSLPLDPINNLTYYYTYKSRTDFATGSCDNSASVCQQYWIGARLEEPEDSTKPIFRCSDYDTLTDGPGCKEVGPDNLMSAANPSN